MKTTLSNRFTIINVLDLQNDILKHQQRLKTIYSGSLKHQNQKQWEGQLNRFHRNRQASHFLRQQRTLDKINYENSIIHNKIFNEQNKTSLVAKRKISIPNMSQQNNNTLDVSNVRKKEYQRINLQNMRIIQKLATARGDLQSYKLKQHEQAYQQLADRISKRKNIKRLRRFIEKKFNFSPDNVLPEIKATSKK